MCCSKTTSLWSLSFRFVQRGLISLSLCSLPLWLSDLSEAQAADFPNEIGQSAFSAITEIVTLLHQDPQTDWNKVDVDALQQHLVDMNLLTLHTKSITHQTARSVVFEITGLSPQASLALKRMVNAHAPFLSSETDWGVQTSENAKGMRLVITPPPEDIPMVKGLGFYGVMTLGEHHRMHHLFIAKGHQH